MSFKVLIQELDNDRYNDKQICQEDGKLKTVHVCFIPFNF